MKSENNIALSAYLLDIDRRSSCHFNDYIYKYIYTWN